MEFNYNDLKAALNLINSYFTEPKDYFMKLSEENTTLKKEKAELENKVKILIDQNDQLTKDITVRTNRNKSLEADAAFYRKTIEGLNAEIAALKEEKAKSDKPKKAPKKTVTVKVDEYDLDKAINDILNELPDSGWFRTFTKVFGDAFKGEK